MLVNARSVGLNEYQHLAWYKDVAYLQTFVPVLRCNLSRTSYWSLRDRYESRCVCRWPFRWESHCDFRPQAHRSGDTR